MQKAPRHRIACAWFCACAILAACRNAEETIQPTQAAADQVPDMHTLDRAHPVLVHPLDPERVDVRQAKFVQIEIAEIVNPRQHALVFEVRARRADGEELALAPFSPFPADNPGKFIVATRGLLEPGGAVVVTMRVPDAIAAGDPLRVRIGAVKLRTE